MCREERCTVCLQELPKSTTRRRLNSDATKHVVPVLRELAGRSFQAECVSALLPCSDDVFLCRACFRKAERLLQLRKEMCGLECQLAERLKQSGEQRGLGLVPAELKTLPPTASDQSTTPRPQRHSTPRRVSALKRRALDTEHADGEAVPTPRRRPSSPSQAPPPKRRALDTPSRRFMQQTHVTGSPAVAVSLV